MKWRVGLGVLLVLVLSMAVAGETLIYEANFDDTDSPRVWWDFVTGDWDLGGGQLVNYDMASTNTNAYSELEQDADLLIYEWKVTYESAANQWAPAVGIHILANNPRSDNRAPSYLLFQDINEVKVYTSRQGALTRTAFAPAPAREGETYVYRTEYRRELGEISFYRDGVLLFTWKDPSPLEWGEYISVRTNGTMAAFHYIKVWAE